MRRRPVREARPPPLVRQLLFALATVRLEIAFVMEDVPLKEHLRQRRDSLMRRGAGADPADESGTRALSGSGSIRRSLFFDRPASGDDDQACVPQKSPHFTHPTSCMFRHLPFF